MSNAETPTKPLRADARRNREAILDAAVARFGTDGLDAQIDDIARTAGVGVGTMYRHFPTKDVLVEALAVRHFEGLAAEADVRLARVDVGADAWAEFSDFIWAAAGAIARDVGLGEITAMRPATMADCAAVKTGLSATTQRIIDRAKADGTIRADAASSDVALIMCGLGKIVSEPAKEIGLDWHRYVELMLAGLRPATI